MDSINKINQILPDSFYVDIPLKEALCIEISKKYTGDVIKFLKDKNLVQEKVLLKKAKNVLIEQEYKKGKYLFLKNNEENNDYELVDLTFLKRVKPINNNSNLILIAFLDVKYHI